MREYLKYVHKYLAWFYLLLCVDLMSAFLLWLANVKAFQSLMVLMILGSLLFFLLILWQACRREKLREQAFFEFLDHPEEAQEEKLLSLIDPREGESVRRIGCILRENRETQRRLREQVKDYEEYVEAWAHEIKTPISLLTFVLDNRRDSLPAPVCRKLDYTRNQIQESVSQMLYYSRLKGVQKDYLFEPLSLGECCREVLEDYKPLLEEKGFEVILETGDLFVISDHRGLNFLLSQFVSNAVKYRKDTGTPGLILKAEQVQDGILLRIKDQGIGVRACDLPFLFEKGFTGDTGNLRKKATGMGLYLAKKIAGDLKITLSVESRWQDGFEIILRFPECV